MRGGNRNIDKECKVSVGKARTGGEIGGLWWNEGGCEAGYAPSHARPCADLAKTPNMRNILYIQQCIHRV